jgi:uncharacterized protein
VTSPMDPRRSNRLIHETSPYLLQHAYNPVDWYPWGPEAMHRAGAEDRPILLSVGYSACHWCHVMAHESFEDAETARLMNELYVPVKVDREERPDVDAVYMEAVQAMTGSGGWPMTVFLTPEGKPFYGGTYYPPTPRYGMPSFRQVLVAVADAWHKRHQELLAAGDRLAEALGRSATIRPGDSKLTPDLPDRAVTELLNGFDGTHGGFGQAPKFPQPMTLDFLLQQYGEARDHATVQAVALTLTQMAHGGIYDHLGGGFHRYSTDAHWLVPHFEKMLYDNAQLVRTYLHAWQVTGDPEYRRVVEQTLNYVVREMTAPEGGFYSTQDADSEGEEGKYFLWSQAEVIELLGPEDARLFMAYYEVTPNGNFRESPGKSILHTPRDANAVAGSLKVEPDSLRQVLDRGHRILFGARTQRVSPGRDDKILAEWNGLMIHAFAEAGASLARQDYLDAAARAADFILTRMTSTANDGTLRMYRSYKDGRARLSAYLEDYAAVGLALLALYESTFELRWLEAAAQVPGVIIQLFFDPSTRGFFQTSGEHEALVVRRKDYMDNALPSGNSLAAELFLRLGRLLERPDYTDYAEGIIQTMAEAMASHPGAFGRLLSAAGFYFRPGYEIAVVGDPAATNTQALLAEIRKRHLPTSVLAGCAPGHTRASEMVPLLAGRAQIEDQATAYVCRNYVCNLPVTGPAALAMQLVNTASSS